LAGTHQSTATDIYSLGAVLYKLLTGRSPHEGQPHDPVQRQRHDVAPASRVNPAVPVDADYILRKALREEPEGRYASVDALASDVDALLEVRPVDARAGDRWYRAQKWLRRNRMPVAAAALVLVSLSAGLFVANRQRAIAERRFQQVRQLANRFIALDAQIRSLEGATKVRSQIVSDALVYLASLGREASNDTELMLEIGNAYLQVARVQGIPFVPNLGLVPEAEDSLRNADTFIDGVLAKDPANRQALLTSAQIAHDRMALVDVEGRRTDALTQAGRAANQLDRFLARGTPTADELNSATQIFSNVAIAYQNSNRFDDSIRYSKRAIDVSSGVDAARMRRAAALGVLSVTLRRVGDLDGAYAAARQSRTMLEADAADSATRFNLSNALWREGLVLGEEGGPNLERPSEALEVFQRALAIAEDQAARDPQDSRSRQRIATVAYEVGNILRHTDPARALQVFDHALKRIGEVKTSVTSKNAQVVLLSGSAYPLRALGRPLDAKARLDRAFGVLRETEQYPANAIEPLSEPGLALRALTDHYEERGDLARAAATNKELLDKIEQWNVNPSGDLRDATVISDLWQARARLLRAAGQESEAAAFERRRRDLWDGWLRKQPENVFARRQIEATSR
jgi:tetratricopeptide (TPR) repeat protein